MGADVNQMAERHLDRDDRPRWVRFAEQQVASGWRLVLSEAEGRAWWSRGDATQLVTLERARQIAALGFTAPAPVINADTVEAAAPPAPSRSSAKPKNSTKMPRVAVGPGERDEEHANLAVALYTAHPPISMRAIGDRLGTYYSRVRALLVARGVAIRPPIMSGMMEEPPAMPKIGKGSASQIVVQFRRKAEQPDRVPMLRAALQERVVAAYRHPVEPTLDQVAFHFRISRGLVWALLTEAGVTRRPRGHRPLGPLPEDA